MGGAGGSEGSENRTATAARATLLDYTGEPVEIGPIEKMSKSKRNTVDPDEIIETYGADVARLFMLSDSPPERDVEWTERGVQGASRFVQRLWRQINQAAVIAESAAAARPGEFGAAAWKLRKTTHRLLAKVSDEIEKLHFNVAVACIYELCSALGEAIGDIDAPEQMTPDFAWAVRETADILVRLFHPMMPHLAEECWAALGHATLVAQAPWPADRARSSDRGHADAAGADQRQEARRCDSCARRAKGRDRERRAGA